MNIDEEIGPALDRARDDGYKSGWGSGAFIASLAWIGVLILIVSFTGGRTIPHDPALIAAVEEFIVACPPL